MSKLAHSHQPTMDEIERQNREDEERGVPQDAPDQKTGLRLFFSTVEGGTVLVATKSTGCLEQGKEYVVSENWNGFRGVRCKCGFHRLGTIKRGSDEIYGFKRPTIGGLGSDTTESQIIPALFILALGLLLASALLLS